VLFRLLLQCTGIERKHRSRAKCPCVDLRWNGPSGLHRRTIWVCEGLVGSHRGPGELSYFSLEEARLFGSAQDLLNRSLMFLELRQVRCDELLHTGTCSGRVDGSVERIEAIVHRDEESLLVRYPGADRDLEPSEGGHSALIENAQGCMRPRSATTCRMTSAAPTHVRPTS
jgi:hypothetical protein